MYTRKLWCCVFLIVFFVIALETCEARRSGFGRSGRFRWGGSRRTSYRSSRRTSFFEHETRIHKPVDHGFATISPIRNRPATRSPTWNRPVTRSPTWNRPVTSRYRVTVPTAGPDVGFRKLNDGRNYYRPPPTLKSLYFPFSDQPHHQSPPVIVNQPVYVNPKTYGNNHDSTLLGTFLGYQMGRHVHGYHHDSDGYYQRPTYAVVHHHHHYDRPIPKEIQVEQYALGQCGNLTGFCTPNTTTLCLKNGTVYCLAPSEATVPCPKTSTGILCVNATVNIPCDQNTTCVPGEINVTTTIIIPCISHVNLTTDIYRDLGGNRVERNGGEVKSFCVTLIAEPLPISKNMTNEEFLEHIGQNAETEKFVTSKHENLLHHLFSSIFSTKYL